MNILRLLTVYFKKKFTKERFFLRRMEVYIKNLDFPLLDNEIHAHHAREKKNAKQSAPEVSHYRGALPNPCPEFRRVIGLESGPITRSNRRRRRPSRARTCASSCRIVSRKAKRRCCVMSDRCVDILARIYVRLYLCV